MLHNKNSKEKLQSSMDAITANVEHSYNNLADSVYKFQEIRKLSVNVRVDRLECGKTLGESLFQNKAKYHKCCKLNFRKNLFTTAAVGNTDVNPKSSTAFTSLHGTAASLSQHLHERNRGVERIIPKTLPSDKVLNKLPSSYTEVPLCYLLSSVEMLQGYEPSQSLLFDELQSITDDDQHWLNDSECASWAVFHAKRSRIKVYADLAALLPIWRNSSKSSATVTHTADVINESVKYINPGQTPWLHSISHCMLLLNDYSGITQFSMGQVRGLTCYNVRNLTYRNVNLKCFMVLGR